jgi:hypothetical protein
MEPIHKKMLLATLGKCNTCEVVVGGTSMWPFIEPGDKVFIRKKPFRPSLGVVVAFFNENQLVVHRIIGVKKKEGDTWQLLIHGDSSPRSQSKIESDQIVGTVEYVKRGNKKITCWFIFPLRIVIIPLGFILQLLVWIKVGIRRNKEECLRK